MRPIFKIYLPICLLFILAGIIFTYPMILNFRSGIVYTRSGIPGAQVQYGIMGDHLQLYYRFWLFKDILYGNSRFLENKYEFNIGDGKIFPVSSYFMPYPVIFFIFSFLGKAAGYNAAILASYLFSGISMYLLISLYTKDRIASLFAGIVFALTPYRNMSILSGHPTGLATFYIPLFLFFIEKTLKEKSYWSAVAGGIAFALLADNDLHTLYLTVLITPVFVIKNLIAKDRTIFWSNLRKTIFPLLLIAFICSGALIFRIDRSPASVSGIQRQVEEVFVFSPALRNGLFGRNNDQQTKYAYLGIPALLFILTIFIINLFRIRKHSDEKSNLWLMVFFFIILFASYALVFGPRFPISSPYKFLHRHLPKFSMMRQTSKIMVISTFSVSVLCGFGFYYLRKISNSLKTNVISVIVLLLIIVDFSTFPKTGAGISILPERNKAYDKVFNDINNEKRVVCVPIWPGNDAWSSLYLYYATIYRTIMINGYNPAISRIYSEKIYDPLRSLNVGQLSRKQYEFLRSMYVEYLILHQEAFPKKVSLFPFFFTLDNFMKSPYMELVAQDSPISIFKILDENKIKEGNEPLGISVVGVVTEAEELSNENVIQDANASNNHCLYFGKNTKASTVVPKRTTPAGNYIISARIKSEDECSIRISVLRSKDDSLIESKSFELNTGNKYEIVNMHFTLDEALSVFYLFEKEGSGLSIDWFYLIHADQKEPVEKFEFEEVFHFGNVHEYAGASQNKAIFLTQKDPIGQVTRGPYRLLVEGEYEIEIFLGLDTGQAVCDEDIVASLTLRNSMDEMNPERKKHYNILFPEKNIKARDFKNTSGINSFVYRFKLDRPEFISVNIKHFGYHIYLDKAEIRRMTD